MSRAFSAEMIFFLWALIRLMDVINQVSKNLRCQSVQWDAAAWVHRMLRIDTIIVHRLFIRPAARNISAAQSPAPL